MDRIIKKEFFDFWIKENEKRDKTTKAFKEAAKSLAKKTMQSLLKPRGKNDTQKQQGSL